MRNVSFLLFLFLFSFSCSKPHSTSNASGANSIASVYISGYGYDSLKDRTTAKYWKDSTEMVLSDGSQDEIANAIFISGDHVYAAGSIGFNHSAGVYWDNGKETTLNPYEITEVSGIFVSGTELHMTGRGPNTDGEVIGAPYFAKYWNNGVMFPMGDENSMSYGNAITGAGHNVYIAWTQYDSLSGYTAAKYSKNDTSTILSDASSFSAGANAICSSGDDVYVAGYVPDPVSHSQVAAYWKNGILTQLHDNHGSSIASGIAVAGHDVYVCGTTFDFAHSKSVATYWKNGEYFPLTDGASISTTCGIAIAAGDVYIAGTVGNAPTYWKNGQVHALPYDPAIHQATTGIFVVRK
jgi:hypothetical protein